ncbi:MAG TPA: hypothetical protein ENK57_16370 [Polyangiaceae bacterium]|nr:hypothetical protein [Polyangiaceae bacterium]
MAGQDLSIKIVALLPVLWGCGVEGPSHLPYPYDGEDDGGAPLEDDGSIGQGAGSSGPGTTGAGAEGTTGAGGAPTTSSSSTGIGTASSGVTTGGGVVGVCTPDGDDDACFVCAKQQCCPEVEACAAEPSCICWVQCVADTLGDVTLCAGQCGAPGAAILDVLDCAGAGCAAECGS